MLWIILTFNFPSPLLFICKKSSQPHTISLLLNHHHLFISHTFNVPFFFPLSSLVIFSLESKQGKKMSQKVGRHQRRLSQGVFVIPDNLSAPPPDNGGGDKVAPPPLPPQREDCAAPSAPAQLPAPAKSLEEMSNASGNKKTG